MIKKFALSMAVCLLVALMASPVPAKTFKLTFGVGAPADPIPFVKTIRDYWAPEIQRRVEANTEHKIKWTLHFSPSVVKITDGFEAVQDGLLDSSIAFPIFENPALFIHNFSYFAPFGSSDQMQATKVNLSVYDNNPWLKQVFEKKHNQKWLANFTYETYDLITKFPVKTVADLKGHKIAAAGPNLPWIKAVGCVPVQSNVMEAYTSLQSGVYEGWVLPASTMLSFKLYEVAKYFNVVGFGAIAGGCLTMNLDVWNTLPADVQKIILDVGRDFAIEVAKETQIKNKAAFEGMKKAGVPIFNLPEEERRQWVKALGNMADEKAKEADKLGQPGTKVMQDYVSGMTKAGYQWPLEWKIK